MPFDSAAPTSPAAPGAPAVPGETKEPDTRTTKAGDPLAPDKDKGADTKLVYLLAHKSREAAKKSWAAFGSDPAWKKAQTESEVNGKLVEKVESVYLAATDYSEMK